MKSTGLVSMAAGIVVCALGVLVPVDGLKPAPSFQAAPGGKSRQGVTVRMEYAGITVTEWAARWGRAWMGSMTDGGLRWLEQSRIPQIDSTYADAACIATAGLVLMAVRRHLRGQRKAELRSLRRIVEGLGDSGVVMGSR